MTALSQALRFGEQAMKLSFRILFLPLVLAASSCAQDAPVEPSAPPQFSLEAGKLEQLARYQTGPLQITIGLALKTIGPEGGSISLGGFEVIVPPGAVDKATRFSIRLPVDPQASEFVRAQFGPHQEFAVPLTIRLPLRGTTSEEYTGARVLWWNGVEWVPFETTLTADGRIEAKTSHFSEYGTEGPEMSKGLILVGGGK
jgi:hypothetical protein